MPLSNYLTPGIYIEEVPTGTRPIQAVGTSTAGFLGVAPKADAHLREAVAINNWSQFAKEFWAEGARSTPLARAVEGFFLNGGQRCFVVNLGVAGTLLGSGGRREGLELLAEIDEIALIAAPGYSDPASHDALLTHCELLGDRVALLDPPEDVDDLTQLVTVATAGGSPDAAAGRSPGLRPRNSDGGYGAFYFPWITCFDPFDRRTLVNVPPSGHIAGICARTDGRRGVHKAPANELVVGALNVTWRVQRQEQGELNQAGVNCIRFFPREGIRVWGARTVAPPSSEWRYLNVRRLFNMIEESIAGSTRWVVFEPNDQTLWKSIRRDISAFLTRLWRDGALMGATPEEAFFVKCDAETDSPEVVDAGQVIALIGVAPVKPAEFIIFRIGQHAGGAKLTTEA